MATDKPLTIPTDKIVQAMAAGDKVLDTLGMSIDHVRAGEATLSMSVNESMINGHSICHGGCIFTLADSAFAYACNSHNDRAVAQTNTITYIKPAKLGDQLTAAGKEISRTGRSGITDVVVTNQDGDVIAQFRGNSRTIGGKHVDEN